jgi:putative pyruvate formate lyase activating enzyme
MRLAGEVLREREAALRGLERPCRLCARGCGIDRTERRPPCGVDDRAHLGGWGIHHGEEPELTGPRGCGLVLMAGCNLACAGCETASFSRELRGVRAMGAAELAGVVLELERRGASHVQFVTPTHQAPVIVSALRRAAAHGFRTSIVWNCGGYEAPEALDLLDGVVDVYLPDLKHGDDAEARLTGVSDYFSRTVECISQMHRQAGLLELDATGLARRGVIVRHLVLPDDAARTREAMRAIASISRQIRVNVMAQYQPVHQLSGHVRLGRRVRRDEVVRAVEIAREEGLTNVWTAAL